MYDVWLAIYKGQYQDGAFLQYLEASEVDFQTTQYGGMGGGKFVIRSKYEDAQTGNLIAPNRVDCYLRAGALTQSAGTGTTIVVSNIGEFKVNQEIVLYDGLNYDTRQITGISGSTLTLDTALSHAYALGTDVMVMRYRGRIASRERTVDLDYKTTIETLPYFAELNDFVATATINEKECGWVIYNILQKYADSLDLYIDSSNFVMSSDPDGAISDTNGNPFGTGVAYSGNNANTQLGSLLKNVVDTANGNNGDITYTLWVDELNTIYFKALNTTTPTVTVDIAHYTATPDGITNIVGAHSTKDQDLTAIANTFKVVGANDPNTNAPVTAEVFDQTSVNQYGQKEQVLSVPTITTVDAAKAYAQARLNQVAFPVEQTQTDLICTGSFATALDLIKIQGFTDNSTQVVNAQSVETMWNAESPGQFQQRIIGAELKPDINKQMRQIMAQHYIALTGVLNPSVNLTDRFVQNGVDGSYSKGSAVFNITKGTLQALINVGGQNLLTQFTPGAYSYTLPTDDLYTIGYLYRNTDGTQYSAPGYVAYKGISVPNGSTFTDYQVIPLFSVTRLGGVIVNANDRRNIGGIDAGNINPGSVGGTQLQPNPNLATPPALKAGTTVSGPVYPVTGGGSYDAAVTFTLSTGAPDWLSDLRLFAVPAGVAFDGNSVPKGDLAPNVDGEYTAIYHLASGQAYDLYCAFVDHQSFVGAPFKLATTTANPIVVNGGNFPAMPNGTTPVLSGSAPSVTYPNVGSATYDAEAVVNLTTVASTQSAWLESIQLVAQLSSQTNNWTVYNEIPANSSGSYTCTWGGLGSGNTYQLGIRLQGFRPGDQSAVLVIGTTSANPIQSAAIATGAVGLSQTTGIFDANGQLNYGLNSQPLQQAVNSSGQVNVSSTTGQLQPSANSSNVQATVGTTANASTGSYLNQNVVATDQVKSFSVLGTQLAALRYDTSLSNTDAGTNDHLWHLNGGGGSVNVNSTLTNGQVIVYDIGTQTDATTANPQSDQLTIGPNATIQALFKHPKFATGGNGNINLGFSNAISGGTPLAGSASVSGSDQPSITHTVADNYTNDPFQTAVSGFSSTATINQDSNTGYNNVQHNGGQGSGSGSNASVTVNYSQNNPAATSISVPMGHYYTSTSPVHCVGTGDARTCTGGDTIEHWEKSANSGIGYASVAGPSGNAPTSAHPVQLTLSGLVYSINTGTYDDTAGTDNTTPSAVQYVVDLLAPNGSQVATWTVTSDQTLTYNGGNGNDAAGTYTWNIYPQWVTDGTGTVYNGLAGGGNVTPHSWSGSASSANGAVTSFATTGANTVGPVDAAHELSLTVNSLTVPSDGNGGTRIDLFLFDPSGTQIASWTGISNGSTYNWNSGSAGAGVYTWKYQTVVTSNNGTGSSTYNGAITGTPYWYQSDPYTYYTYSNHAGAATSYTTDAATVAPTNAGTQISVVVQSLTAGSDGYGSGALNIQIKDPNGNIVANQNVTATGTYSYSNAGATAGVYTAILSAVVNSNTHTSNTTAQGGDSYAVTASGYVQYYKSIDHPITTWYNNSGQISTYLTPNNTAAPVNAGTQLSLNLTSVTTPSNSSGTSYLVVTLTDPNNTVVYDSTKDATFGGTGSGGGKVTAAHNFTYSNASAVAGVYTWTIYGQANNNQTTDSQYAVSWAGSNSYYVPAGNAYVWSSDQTTKRTATNDADVHWDLLTPDTAKVSIHNDTAQSVSFYLSFDVKGV